MCLSVSYVNGFENCVDGGVVDEDGAVLHFAAKSDGILCFSMSKLGTRGSAQLLEETRRACELLTGM
jgi:hypothetical protein